MTIEENKIITWYCEKCPHTNDDVGEFQESSDIFKQVKEVHQNHKGWQKGKPKESLKNGVGGNDSFNEIDIDDYNDSVKEVNKKIDQESKSFNNKNYDLVAEIIQSENNFLTFRETKEMWNYDEDEGMYMPLADTFIAESCQRMIQKCKRSAVLEVVDTIRRNKTMIHMKDLLESRIINTQNYILDPKTFELKHHSPEYLTYTKLPFSINFESRNLKLWNHILTIIDPKDITLIMELIWICISWENPFKKMFVFKGLTNTQKSTLADILVWIIGTENIAREKPLQFLSNDSRFSTSKFIGKRINIASEIGNLDENMIENQKSLVGGELQNTERKGDNTERYFDPTRFVFLYTTNTLGKIYSSINDYSVITRFQFLIFRNQLDDDKTNGQWYDVFFDNDEDKQSSIETIVNIIIHYKKAQSLGNIPKTKWSNIADTKKILDEEMPIEDKYFRDERIITQSGSKLSIDEIKKDFESFVGYKVHPQEMGYILKKNGFHSNRSNGITSYKSKSFATVIKKGQTTIHT
jgi:phage/plasmid-associated DNA primase